MGHTCVRRSQMRGAVFAAYHDSKPASHVAIIVDVTYRDYPKLTRNWPARLHCEDAVAVIHVQLIDVTVDLASFKEHIKLSAAPDVGVGYHTGTR